MPRAAPAGRPTRGRRSAGNATAYRRVSRGRLVAVVIVVIAGFGALTLKLAQLQAVSPKRYASQAKSQRFSTEKIVAPRGAILDRTGEPLVTTQTRRTIWADPQLVVDPKGAAEALAPLLQMPVTQLNTLLVATSRFSYLKRAVDDEVADRVEALHLAGVYSLAEATRFSPSADLGLSVVGYTDPDTNGIAGIEKQYDQLLVGLPGEIVQERSRDGHTIPDGARHESPATPGSDLMLTLDRSLQHTVETALAAQVDKLSARGGTAVVMDPSTGEILAMASVGRDRDKDGELTGPARNTAQNLAITTTYEPGSVMKLITMSAAIDGQMVSKDTVRHVPPSVAFYNEPFSDDSRYADEDMSVAEILARSSNVGTIMLADQLGSQPLYDTYKSFGFGERTGIGLEQEEPGSVPPLEDWSGTSLPTLAIGQGMTATPLQLLVAYNAIANGGELVAPTIVRSVIGNDGVEERKPLGARRRVVTEDTASQMRTMLTGVVDVGTGANAAVPGYKIAGKTGTAWKVRPDGTYGSAGDRDYIATFVGFAPAVDPRLSMVVVIDEPKGGRYSGGLAAAPVFAEVARAALVTLDIPPSIPGTSQPPDGVNLRAHTAEPRPTLPPTTVPPPPAPASGQPSGTGAQPGGAQPGQPAGASKPPGNTTTATTPGTVAQAKGATKQSPSPQQPPAGNPSAPAGSGATARAPAPTTGSGHG